jgi:membrane-associated HD superfamily phosphohydrolase
MMKDLAKSSQQWRKSVKNSVSMPFAKLSDNQKFWLGFAALCLTTTFLISNPFWTAGFAEQYKEGDIARESIISPADIYVADVEESDRRRQAIQKSVRPIFTFESNRAAEAVQSFRALLENLQRKSDAAGSNTKVAANLKSERQTSGETPDASKLIAARKFSPNEIEAITRILRENAEGSIYGDQDRQYFQDELTLNDRQKPNQQSVVKMPESSMTALSAARNELREDLKQIRTLSEAEADAFGATLAPLIQPSIVYDGAATDNARAIVVKNVAPVTITLKRTQRVVTEGDIITAEVLSQIAAIRKYSSQTRQANRFLGLLAICLGAFLGRVEIRAASGTGIAHRVVRKQNFRAVRFCRRRADRR